MKWIDKTGEIHITNEGYKIKIIAYRNKRECDILFEEGHILKNRMYQHIKKGEIKNPYHKSVYGIGYVGIGKYIPKIHGKDTIEYQIWHGMLTRCYNPNHHLKQPTYKDCEVDEKWFCFQTFAEWFTCNYVEGYHLDKDILLKGNKVYSEKTCFFIPPRINTLLIKSKSIRGEYPIGVSFNKRINKYSATCHIDKKRKHLGYFDTPEQAFNAYKIAKEAEIKRLAEEYKDKIDLRVYDALINYQVEITD